jgi:hypothetical protein
VRIGDTDWLKRERLWLTQDIEQQLHILSTLEDGNPLKASEKQLLADLRKDLKLLKSNPREYVREIKKRLSSVPVRPKDS